jgi:hypothetical protein
MILQGNDALKEAEKCRGSHYSRSIRKREKRRKLSSSLFFSSLEEKRIKIFYVS